MAGAGPGNDEFGGILRSDGAPRTGSPDVQFHGGADAGVDAVHAWAAQGVSGSSQPLPHLDAIQASFGPDHDVSGIRAHVGGTAHEAATSIGAEAYAAGTDVAFRSQPDLHLAAHEAAHVVQQRGGVQLSSGVGRHGDAHELHADAVADRVVQGSSAADLLAQYASGGSSSAVQAKSLRQTMTNALAPAPGHGAVQCQLADDVRAMLTVYGPVHYQGLIQAIHAASTAERQAVLNDANLRALINQRLSGEWAQSVMSSLLEGSQKWKNPPQNDFFTYFVTNNGSGTLPNTATMNCWESIMYAAYLANQVSASWIAQFYQQALQASDPNAAVWSQLGFSTSLPTYAAPGTSANGTVTPSTGQLLFYHSGGNVPGHVAVSLGGDQAISLWNQPNNVDAVQRIRVTDLSGTVYVGNSPW